MFAGDVTPIDVMCHLPAVCEEKNLPYVYTPSRQLLGTAMGVKRGSLMVLIREHEDYKDLFEECKTEIEKLPPVIVWCVNKLKYPKYRANISEAVKVKIKHILQGLQQGTL